MGRTKQIRLDKLPNLKKKIFDSPETLLQSNINNKKIILEIGCGNGNFFSYLLKQYPNDFCVGCEILKPRIVRSFEKATQSLNLTESQALESDAFGLFAGDAKKFLESIPKKNLKAIYINFPDPRLKRAHWKHRFFQQEILDMIYEKMPSGGKIHVKTDDYEYFYFTRIMFFLQKKKFRESLCDMDLHATIDPRESQYPLTEFEERWLLEGRKVYYAEFERV